VSRRFAFALLAISIPILIICFWPTPRTIFSTSLTLPELTQPVSLTLNYPNRLYRGDADTIILTLDLDSDSTATSFAATDPKPLATIRVETNSFGVDPRGEIAQPAARGTTLLWKWKVTASEEQAGRELTLVLQWRLPAGPDQLLWVRTIQIETTSLLGLPISLVRFSTFTATLISLILLTLTTRRPKP